MALTHRREHQNQSTTPEQHTHTPNQSQYYTQSPAKRKRGLGEMLVIATATALPISILGGIGLAKITAGDSLAQEKTEETTPLSGDINETTTSIKISPAALEARENLDFLYDFDSVSFVRQERTERNADLNRQYQDFASDLNRFIFHEGGDNVGHGFEWRPDTSSLITVIPPQVEINGGGDNQPELKEYFRIYKIKSLNGNQTTNYIEVGFDSNGNAYRETGVYKSQKKAIIDEHNVSPEVFVDSLAEARDLLAEGRSLIDSDTLAAQHQQVKSESGYNPDKYNSYDIFPE